MFLKQTGGSDRDYSNMSLAGEVQREDADGVIDGEHFSALGAERDIIKDPVVIALSRLIDLVEQIPSFAQLEESGFSNELVEYGKNILSNVTATLTSLSKIAPDAFGRLLHDINNIITPLLLCFDMIEMINTQCIVLGARDLNSLRENLDRSMDSLLRVCSANLSIVSNSYNLKNVNLAEGLLPAINAIAKQFSVNVIDGDKNTEISKNNIVIDVPHDLSVTIDVDALFVVLDNLLKNPLRMFGGENIGIKISVKVLPYDCIEIVVHDTGHGIDYFNLLEKYKLIAVGKESSGSDLTDFDKLVLRGTVSIDDLITRLFTMGESASGSTGIGLSTVKKVIFGHGGNIEMGNHSDGGACVSILLPNIESNDGALRAKMVTNAQIAMGKFGDVEIEPLPTPAYGDKTPFTMSLV